MITALNERKEKCNKSIADNNADLENQLAILSTEKTAKEVAQSELELAGMPVMRHMIKNGESIEEIELTLDEVIEQKAKVEKELELEKQKHTTQKASIVKGFASFRTC